MATLAVACVAVALGRPASPDLAPTFTEPAARLDVALEWRRGMYGAIGSLRVTDLERDGAAEIVGVSSARWWTASARGGAYEQSWVSSPYAEGISSLVIANADGDRTREVLLASGSSIFIYDGATRRLQDALEAPGKVVRHLHVSDLEGDGGRDLIFCSRDPAPTALYVYDLSTGAQKHVFSSVTPGEYWNACGGLAVGNVDDDAAREIVVGNGSHPGYVIDGLSHGVEWTNPLGFGTLRLGDIDGEGPAEIVSAMYEGIRIFDARRQTLARTLTAQVTAMDVSDVDGDGFADILYGADYGGVSVAFGPDQFRIAPMPIRDDRKYSIATGDVDGNGTIEVVVGAGSWETGHLHVVDPVTLTVRWTSRGDAGPFYGIAYGDVDANGAPDLLHTATADVASDPPYAGGGYFVYGARRWRLRHVGRPEVEDGRAQRIRALNVDVDDDPQDEIVTGPGLDSYHAGVRCYDGVTGEAQWFTPLPPYRGMASLGAGDVDGDGRAEIVVGTGSRSVGYGDPVFVYVLDAATGAVEWESPALGGGGSVTLLRLAQLDLDSALEIVAARDHYGDVFVLDGAARDVKPLGALGATALDTPDRDGDGHDEIVLGTSNGDLRVIDPTTGGVIETVGRYGYRIEGLAVGDYNADGVADYSFGMGERVRILDGQSRVFLWVSDLLGSGSASFPTVGKWDSLVVADVDQDGFQELVVNTGTSLDVFELRPAGARPARRYRRP